MNLVMANGFGGVGFTEMNEQEVIGLNGGKRIICLFPSMGPTMLANKYLLSFVDDFMKGFGKGVDDARRDYNNGIIR